MRIRRWMGALLCCCVLAEGAVCAEGSSIFKRRKKDKKTEAAVPKDSLSADYRKVITGAKTAHGLFTTHFVAKDNKLYMELSETAFSHLYILASRVASTSNTREYVAGQMAGNPIMFRFSKDSLKVYMHRVQRQNVVRPGDPIAPSFARNFADPVMKGFKIVASNKGNVVVDVTSFFGGNEQCISPMSSGSGPSSYGGLKGSFYSEGSGLLSVKTFPNNIEIESQLSYTLSSSDEPYSLKMHRSLFVLPDEPMKMRLQDNRVGYFSSARNVYTSDADKILPQKYIHRWRLEPKPEDRERYFRGELVEPAKPIVFYVDTVFPDKWRKAVKQGIEDWNKAFESAGFKHAVRAVDYPKDDPDFDPDDMRYSCVKYAVTSIANAMGPSYVDPRSGEILTADVIWYHNIISLLHNWRFVQTAAVDPRVRKAVFDDEVMQESIRYAAAHEIGHTLGLMHNMGASYAFSVDSLRSPSFTQKYGTTPSIMDYARNNYVAQPGDWEKGVRLTPPVLGVYDVYAINWGYRLIPGVDTPEAEKPVLDQWIEEKKHDPMYEFGAQQAFSTVDPTDQTEDLGNDHILAGDLAISNLRIIMKNLSRWAFEKGARYDDIQILHGEICSQYVRHFYHVVPYIGGVRFREVRQGDHDLARHYVDKATQRRALRWLVNQALTYRDWLIPQELVAKWDVSPTKLEGNLAADMVAALFRPTVLCRIDEGGKIDARTNYTLEGYMDDAMREVFKSLYKAAKPGQAEMEMQAAAVELMIEYSGLDKDGKKDEGIVVTLLNESEELVRRAASPSLPCYGQDDKDSFTRFNIGMPPLDSTRLSALMTGCLKRLLPLYRQRKASASGAVRDFYDYQAMKIDRVLNGE